MLLQQNELCDTLQQTAYFHMLYGIMSAETILDSFFISLNSILGILLLLEQRYLRMTR